jgi:hypothetical protein
VGNFVPFLIFAGYIGAAVGALVWLAARVRRRGIGGGVMAPVDQILRPTAFDSRIEIEQQEERMMPMPSPEDK